MIKKQPELDLSEDCGCLYLACEDNLDDVDLEDCQCADCLEAKIEACIEITGEENRTAVQYIKHKTNDNRLMKHSNTDAAKNNNTQPSQRPKTSNQTQTHHCHGRWAGLHSHTRETVHKQSPKKSHHQIKRPILKPVRSCGRFKRQHLKPQLEMPEQPAILDLPELLPEVINVEPVKKEYNKDEMILFANRRIHENLLKHQQQKAQEKQLYVEFRLDRLQDQQQKKDQLAALQAKARMLIETAPKGSKKNKKPWSYTEQHPQVHTTSCCHKIHIKPKTETNNYNKEEMQKHKFLKSIYKRIKLQMATKKHTHVNHKLTEQCPYHQHEKSQSCKQQKQIVELVEKNAKKVIQQMTQKFNKLKQIERLKDAKLRGLAIEAKKILTKSKKQAIKGRPDFAYDIAQQLRLKREQLRKEQEKENQKQKLKSANLNATGKSSKSGQKDRTSKNKGVNNESKQQMEVEITQRDENYLEKAGKFYVWDIPIKVDQVDAAFNSHKIETIRETNSFRKEVEEQIERKMRRKTQSKVTKTEHQIFQEKVQKQKTELMREFSRKGSVQLDPSITQTSRLRKDIVTQPNTKSKF